MTDERLAHRATLETLKHSLEAAEAARATLEGTIRELTTHRIPTLEARVSAAQRDLLDGREEHAREVRQLRAEAQAALDQQREAERRRVDADLKRDEVVEELGVTYEALEAAVAQATRAETKVEALTLRGIMGWEREKEEENRDRERRTEENRKGEGEGMVVRGLERGAKGSPRPGAAVAAAGTTTTTTTTTTTAATAATTATGGGAVTTTAATATASASAAAPSYPSAGSVPGTWHPPPARNQP